MAIAIDETEVYEAIKERDVGALCMGLDDHLSKMSGAYTASHVFGSLRFKLQIQAHNYGGQGVSFEQLRDCAVGEYSRLMEFLVEGARRGWWSPR